MSGAIEELFVEGTRHERVFVRHRPGRDDRVPLLLLDGLGCAGFVWRHLWNWFEGHGIVHMQYRGHGRSDIPKDTQTMTVATAIDDVVRVLDQLGINRTTVVGHSMGVQVALEAAHRLPSRVVGLGLLCGSYEHPIASWHGAPRRDGPPRLDNLALRAVFDPLSRFFINQSHHLEQVWRALFATPLAYEIATRSEVDGTRLGVREFGPYMADLAAIPPKVFFGFARSLAEHSAQAYLRSLHIPAFVLGGGRDTFTPRWRSEEMAARLPQAELVVLENGTHTAPLEYPAALQAGLMRMLRRAQALA